MSSHMARLAKDWKLYVGIATALSSALTAFTDVFAQLSAAVSGLRGLPPETRWLVAAVLLALAVVALVAALSRRSILVQPKRFIISAEEPSHLVGREEDIAALAKECSEHALVFLVGESGAGKSALVRSGLMPHLQRAPATAGARGALLPVRMDLSAAGWAGGLRLALAQAVLDLPEAEQAALGVPASFQPEEVFAALRSRPEHTRRHLLVILDQFDDYVIAHREHFFHPGTSTMVRAAELEAASTDWSSLAELVRQRHLHALVVSRKDVGAFLEAVRFTEPCTFFLAPVDTQLIRPLLDLVSAPGADGKEVIEYPEYGWHQLKSRLLRDLSTSGKVLPVQLALALGSLRRFHTLTIGEYTRRGGARGLERLYIERQIHDAAKVAGISDRALLRGLMCLVSKDGSKTQRAGRQAFADAVLGAGADARKLDVAIEHLERWRVVRRLSADGQEVVVLHHDYLAPGVREAQRHANRWADLVRGRADELREALGWWRKWRALLPLRVQARLLWERLRSRFVYGEHRGLAWWSTLRLVPVLALAGLVGLGVWWQDRRTQEHLAETILAGVGHGDFTRELAP